MEALSISGVYAPIPTPFETDGSVALDKLAENIEKWSKTELAGLLVLGSNGEFTYLSDKEKIEVLKTARQAIPKDMLFIAGTGCDSTISTLELTEKAAAIGADAAMVITPMYYPGKMDARAMRRHYMELAEHSSLPVFIYNMPANTGVDLPAETVVELAQHPNIVGIKDSSGNVVKIGDIIRAAPPNFNVLAGSASFLYPALMLGAVGGVMALGNIAPEHCHRIYKYAREGWHEKAQELQLKILPSNAAVTARFGVPGLKQAMDWIGYYGGPPRSPLGPLDNDQQTVLRAILKEGGIL
ncbi:MAG: dihydrodipicolinate synthase family protein [Deltaproteobacteria bacterium]|nr:dihydrodipicolinate synthase family protein [Deltaproteobacteria bacterium]MBW1919681.1 dihydrodipicolinate synthase family protein [Deltaproteobacteria bacterium]MBW1936639.1 dihydrodipicolinate synthase family protein [Deltaproteobacteria bacterium]MBW1979353.1 dihydrodipicolinate synthase family protein [Deltaproteobacteria bacterium]MBW2046420.1 dihydrodipicolinate synthase family protein [Deltaproteobacteria bacterium]